MDNITKPKLKARLETIYLSDSVWKELDKAGHVMGDTGFLLGSLITAGMITLGKFADKIESDGSNYKDVTKEVSEFAGISDKDKERIDRNRNEGKSLEDSFDIVV